MTTDKRYECSVTVNTEFLLDQSDVQLGRYAFSYHITIINII
jgi:ApaG protein